MLFPIRVTILAKASGKAGQRCFLGDNALWGAGFFLRHNRTQWRMPMGGRLGQPALSGSLFPFH